MSTKLVSDKKVTPAKKTSEKPLQPQATEEDQAPRHYIAIGASAGGLEALQELFQSMPCDTDAAFIVIQHLSPDFKSVMDELLNRNTKMPVINATDNLLVQKNTVYLITPRKNMMIAEGKLLLVDQMQDKKIHFPVDIFFRSLAEDQHHRSIGIIVSGTGSDGSRGIQAIKEVGGLVIIQDPATAKFDGMPYSAVKTGFADVILSPNEIPDKLNHYMTHPLNKSETSILDQDEDGQASLSEVFKLLKNRSDIDFTQYKISTVARRIERRLGLNQLTRIQDYHALLLTNPHELQTLAKDMLIGVTRFFRDPEVFTKLEETAIPNILEKMPPTEPIRIWIAGCSTGEEAYSIAILFMEAMKKRKMTWNVKIFATDVDPDAITEASGGKFDLNIQSDVSEQRLATYFTKENQHYQINPELRSMVIFANHNLMKDPPFSNTNLAVCRNVLIYFQHEAQKRVISMLHFSLQKDGFLLMGSSESLGDLQSHFNTIHERSRLYQKKSGTRVLASSIGERGPKNPTARATPSLDNLMTAYKQTRRISHGDLIIDQLTDGYIPPCILLNSEREVLHVYGDVSRFTCKPKPGRFSSNINDLIEPSLSVALSTALHKSHTSQSEVIYENIRTQLDNGDLMVIDLKVRYVVSNLLSSAHFLVIFDVQGQVNRSNSAESIPFNQENQSQQRILDLESELKKNQEHLQINVEELETTNEELQSSNEELMAANEELQSTNEELQSVNEELFTVNSEYQEKIDELMDANSDLDNFIVSTDIGIIFLDHSLTIRNFTPATTKYINLMETDIGRPFHHIAHHLDYPQFLADIGTVIESKRPIEKEIRIDESSSIMIQIRPYLDKRELSKGAVISLTDTSRLHQLSTIYNQLQIEISDQMSSDPKPLNVLIVDDSKADRVLLKKALMQSTLRTYTILEAEDLEDAVVHLQETQIDLCLLDFQLNNMTAFEALREIKQSTQVHPAFILVSGFKEDKMHRKALKAGFYDFIEKDNFSSYILDRCIHYATQHQTIKQYIMAGAK